MIFTIQLKRGSAASWTSSNYVLANGELGIEIDTRKMKAGDGTTPWNSLEYILTDVYQDSTHRVVTDAQIAAWSAKYTRDEVDSLLAAVEAELRAVATASSDGMMSMADKIKLDGVADGANNYVHPESHPASMISQDSSHRFVTDDQVASFADKYTKVETDQRIQVIVGAAPAALDTLAEIAAQLASDESATATLTNVVSQKAPISHTHPATDVQQDSSHRLVSDAQVASWNGKAETTVASESANGLMASSDKTKLDGIAAGAEANVNPDWSASSGDGQILNKPDGDTLLPGFSKKYLDFPTIADPSAPALGSVRFYGSSMAGRSIPKWVGNFGIDMAIQAMVAFNKVAWWNPPGNATTVPGVCGMAAYTVVGTPTARNVATTNMFTRMKRLGILSRASAGSLVGVRQPVAQFTLGNGSDLGGFMKIIRFGISDPAAVSVARMFMGMSSSTAAPTNVEPSTLTNSIGIGHGASDANMKLFYGGSTAQTPIDLGANFPKNTLSVDVYELMLFAPSTQANVIYYKVTRLNTGHVAEGTITATSAGVQLPSATTLLNMTWSYRTNNTAGDVVGLDIMSDYIETDY